MSRRMRHGEKRDSEPNTLELGGVLCKVRYVHWDLGYAENLGIFLCCAVCGRTFSYKIEIILSHGWVFLLLFIFVICFEYFKVN